MGNSWSTRSRSRKRRTGGAASDGVGHDQAEVRTDAAELDEVRVASLVSRASV